MRSDSVEILRRVRTVQEWILKDYYTSDIVSQCVAKWGVSERQALRYVSDARKLFEDVTKLKLAQRMAYHISRRQKLLQDMPEDARKTPAGIQVQLSIIQDIARLEQLYKTQVQLSTPDDKPIRVAMESNVDYTKLSSEALQEIINARTK